MKLTVLDREFKIYIFEKEISTRSMMEQAARPQPVTGQTGPGSRYIHSAIKKQPTPLQIFAWMQKRRPDARQRPALCLTCGASLF